MIAPEQVAGHLADLAPYLSICEAQLLDFSSRAGYGPWLKVRVENPDLLVGMKPGQRFHLMLIAIGDDDMPATNDPEKRKPYKASQIAGMMCNEPSFRQFITATYGEACPTAEDAAVWLRESCGVESRSYLDSNPAAAEIFQNIIREFDEWKKGAA